MKCRGEHWKRVAQEWVEGVFPRDFEVLDIGAGTSPAFGATRAVDINRDLFTKDGNRLKKKVEIPGSLVEYINYDARALPYGDGFFDRIISRWAIGARIKGIAVIREAYRVLKSGGEIYIAILEEDKQTIPPTKCNLKSVGFETLDIYNGEYSEEECLAPRKNNLSKNSVRKVIVKESVIHAKKE